MKKHGPNLLFVVVLIALFLVDNGIDLMIRSSTYLIEILIVSYVLVIYGFDFFRLLKQVVDDHRAKKKKNVKKPKRHRVRVR